MLSLLGVTLLLVSSRPVGAPQAGAPKPTVSVKDAAKTLPKLDLLPRMMLLPLNSYMEGLPTETTDGLVKGYTDGLNASAKVPKGSTYRLIPIKTVQEGLKTAKWPYIVKDKDGHNVWDIEQMLNVARGIKADFLGVPRITEMTFTPAKNQTFCRGYLTVYRVSDSERVIKDGWLGGQSTGLGLTTPFAVARSFAVEDIPRRFWEDYARDHWHPLGK